MNGIGSHHSPVMKNDEWLTPKAITDSFSNGFDLDPCSPGDRRPWDTAKKHFSKEDDGLQQKWFGTVWCNPPYGKEACKWLQKLKEHGNGIALVFARTETKMFFEHVWEDASAVLFIEGRLYFHHVDGTRAKSNSGAPSVLIAYGEECKQELMNCGIKGKFIGL